MMGHIYLTAGDLCEGIYPDHKGKVRLHPFPELLITRIDISLGLFPKQRQFFLFGLRKEFFQVIGLPKRMPPPRRMGKLTVKAVEVGVVFLKVLKVHHVVKAFETSLVTRISDIDSSRSRIRTVD